jgi:hypothetical protein
LDEYHTRRKKDTILFANAFIRAEAEFDQQRGQCEYIEASFRSGTHGLAIPDKKILKPDEFT